MGDSLFPSRAVYEIGMTVERCFRRAINANSGFPPRENEFSAVLASTILRELLSTPSKIDSLFPRLDEHIFDEEPEDLCGHIYFLVQTVVKEYIELRMYLSKICTMREVGDSIGIIRIA